MKRTAAASSISSSGMGASSATAGMGISGSRAPTTGVKKGIRVPSASKGSKAAIPTKK